VELELIVRPADIHLMEAAAAGNRCKFASMCRFYRSQDYTCNNEDEAWTYCGTYELFANFKPSKEMEIER
jgi:hypothetical protein